MRLFGLILFLGISNLVFGQKFLQIEKYGSPKVKKFYIGDDLTYRIKGDKTWYTGTIQDLIIAEDIILFENRFVKMGDITMMRKRLGWSQKIGTQLYIFAGSWLFFSGTAALVGWWEVRWDTAIIAGSALVTGFLIKKIFKYKKYKFGKRRRLRMLDISIPKPKYFGP